MVYFTFILYFALFVSTIGLAPGKTKKPMYTKEPILPKQPKQTKTPGIKVTATKLTKVPKTPKQIIIPIQKHTDNWKKDSKAPKVAKIRGKNQRGQLSQPSSEPSTSSELTTAAPVLSKTPTTSPTHSVKQCLAGNWYVGKSGESCTEVCASYSGQTCDLACLKSAAVTNTTSLNKALLKAGGFNLNGVTTSCLIGCAADNYNCWIDDTNLRGGCGDYATIDPCYLLDPKNEISGCYYSSYGQQIFSCDGKCQNQYRLCPCY